MEKLTINDVNNFESEVDYTTVLDNFEGPLDLLLYLIKEEQIEIKDIFVSQVTDQFLSYMKALPYLDVEKASEYLYIASTIIEIKAKALLPVIEDEDYGGYEDEDYSPEQDLIEAIEQYQLLKEEAAKLKERETVGYFFKEPDKELNKTQVVYKDFTLDGLMKAFADLMLRKESEQSVKKQSTKSIQRDTFTVKDKIKTIREAVEKKEKINFEDLFTEDSDKIEIVTTFQALLELLKHQYLLVSQEELFSTIVIEKNPDRSEEDEIGEIDEYN